MCLGVYLRYSTPGPINVAVRCKGFVNSGAFSTVVPLGDLNGDGVDDFGTTAPTDALLNPPQGGYFIIFSGDTTLVTDVKEKQALQPKSPILQQNYPNPFNPSFTIEYNVPKKGNVLLVVYDVSGKEIAKLVDTYQAQGNHKVIWNGKSSNGQAMATGAYFYTLTIDGVQRETKKLLLLK